jgi:predicted nucleotidyltransferase
MRLTNKEIYEIKNNFRKNFSANDHLWLFGSRVNDAKKGGDIDLYIETSLTAQEAVKKEMTLVSDLWHAIGEQKIDVVLNLMHTKTHLPIYHVARTEGIQLV